MCSGELGEPRVVRGARSTLDDGARLVGARGGEEQGDVPRHVQETHRQRDRVAARRPGIPVRPSARRRTRAPPGCPRRGRASRRTAAPPRTSSRTRRGPSGRRWRSASSISLRAHLRAAADPDVGFVERKDLRGVGRVDEVEGGSVRDVVAVAAASPRARSTCTRRRAGARRSRCPRAPARTLRRARRGGPRARRCASRARAAARCRGRSRARARRPPRQHGSAAHLRAALLRLLRDPSTPRRHPTRVLPAVEPLGVSSEPGLASMRPLSIASSRAA